MTHPKKSTNATETIHAAKETRTMNKSNTMTNLREAASEKVAAWHAAQKVTAAASEQYRTALADAEKKRPVYQAIGPMTRLALIDLEGAALEAEDAERLALADATFAVDAAERAEGNELAAKCDPERLHGTLTELLTEETRLRDEYAAARARTAAFIDGLYAASEALDKIRGGAGLPPSARLPRPPNDGFGIDREKLVQRLASMVGQVVAPTKSNADRAQALRREADRICADLEQERLDKEERIAEAAAYDRRQEAKRKEDEERNSREIETLRAKHAAENDKTTALAAAHRARA